MMRAVEAHSCRRHSPAGQCGAPFFCALDALAINDRSARAGVSPRQLPACHIERVVNAPERAVVVPSVEVVVQGAARRQVLGDRGPLAARAQDVHEAVGYLAQVDRPLVAAALGSRDQWGDQRPFLVGQVTWVAQLATVVATTVLTRPHQRLPPNRNAAKEITTNSKHSRCSRMDTNHHDQTSLLWASNGIVSRIEVRDQNPFEAAEYLLRRTSFARSGIDECHLLQVRENPNVATLASNCRFGFVSVDKPARCNFF